MHPRPPSTTRFSPKRPSGYSLMEMLFVLSLTIVLFAVAAAGAKKSWQSQELKASAIHLAHDLTLASQSAQKLNKPVVVRFYRYFADAVASDKPHYHAYQLLVQDTEASNVITARPVFKPLFELQTLEGTTLISENAHFTSLLYSPPDQRDPTTDQDLSIGSYEYFTVEFRPNGSTNIAPNQTGSGGYDVPTITLIPARGADQQDQLPADYQTLVLHPGAGTVSVY